jgi:hypothetical protein
LQVNYRPSDPKAQSFAPTLTNAAYASSSFSHLNLFESTDVNSGTGISAAKEQGKSNTSDELTPDSKSTVSRQFDSTKVYVYPLILVQRKLNMMIDLLASL